MTCKSSGGSSGSNRKFKAPYTLIRNGSGRKSSHRNASSGFRIFCQCLCYSATAVIGVMTVAAIFWLQIELKMQQQDFSSQIGKGWELSFRKKVIAPSVPIRLASPPAAQLSIFIRKSVVLHLHEGPDLGRIANRIEEIRIKPSSTWRDLNPRLLCHEACALPLCYNRCPSFRKT